MVPATGKGWKPAAQAHEEGRWVREAAMAHAQKKADKKAAA